MIRFACPGCSATFTVGDEKAGKTGKCPKCQSQFVIPAADAGAPAADLPPPPPPPVKNPSRPSAPPLPPPPPAADPNAPVEIAPCPKCDTRLSVLPTDVGVDIQCPNCETVFRATRADAPPPPDAGGKGKGSSALVKLGSGSDKDDDEDDDRPSKRKSKRRDDDDDDDRPSRRRSSRRDDDDDDDRPSRRRRSRRGGDDGYLQPDQSTLILVFTIIGGVMCWNIVGIGMNIASLIISNINIKEIDAGRMVATNRGQIGTCRTVNIVCLILFGVGLVCYCGFWAIMIGGAAASR